MYYTMIHSVFKKNNSFYCKNSFMHIIQSLVPIQYEDALMKMHSIVNDIIHHRSSNVIWFLEHNAIYTAGYTTYNEWKKLYGEQIICNGQSIPLIQTERGGKITFHGPGQRVCYLMVNLKEAYNELNLSKFLNYIHELIIQTLREFGIHGIRDKVYPGVWIEEKNSLKKIAAIGIKIRRGISYHGFALNINTDMNFFDVITPCGINDINRGVTSMASILNTQLFLSEVDVVMQKKIKNAKKYLEF